MFSNMYLCMCSFVSLIRLNGSSFKTDKKQTAIQNSAYSSVHESFRQVFKQTSIPSHWDLSFTRQIRQSFFFAILQKLPALLSGCKDDKGFKTGIKKAFIDVVKNIFEQLITRSFPQPTIHDTCRAMRLTMQAIVAQMLYESAEDHAIPAMTRTSIVKQSWKESSVIPSTGAPHFISDVAPVALGAHVTKPTTKGSWKKTHKLLKFPLTFNDTDDVKAVLEHE